ncbi:MAG: rod shape-determining protein MreC [Candidatus Portnoybacteria bacterium]|nr:rod shape-determining protein MreC [Candidatus Portnoybacteria bacterium]
MNIKKLSPYLLTVIAFFSVVYFLPSIGGFLTKIRVRMNVFVSNVYRAQELGSEYQKLLEENRALKSELVALAKLEKENDFLRQGRSLEKAVTPKKFLLSSVIGKGSSFSQYAVVIDRGTNDGIHGGEAVIINPNVLIGIVENVFLRRSVIKLLFDNSFSLRARTLKGADGVITGSVGGKLLLKNVLPQAILKQGDIVVTGNERPEVPAGLLIGEVEKIISQPTDVFLQAQLKAFFDPHTLERVFIVQ